MKTQLAIAAGILFALSTAVATNVSNPKSVDRSTTVQADATDLSSEAAIQVVSLWKDHANSAASTRLARPL